MRTPPRSAALVAAIAGIGALFAGAPASAQTTTNISLSTCTSWSINGGIFSCTTSGTGGGGVTAPSGCSVSVNPSSGAAGTPVNVAVSCTGGDAPTSWSWTGGFMAGQNTAGGSGNLSASTTFKAIATNSAGSSPQVSGTFTLTNTGGGGGNTGGGISCTGYSTMVIPVTAQPGILTPRYASSNYGSFGNGAVAVVKFSTSASASGNGRISFAEFASGPVMRTLSLSTSPCDFTPKVSGGTALVVRTGTGYTLPFSITTPVRGSLTLSPSTTYYLNIKNEVDGAATCPGACDIGVDLLEP